MYTQIAGRSTAHETPTPVDSREDSDWGGDQPLPTVLQVQRYSSE